MLLSMLTPSLAVAETATLDELFAAVDADAALLTATTASADAEYAAAPIETRMPGPHIGVGTRVIPGESELEVELGQSFPLGGARKQNREARRAESKALRADGEQRLMARRVAVARHFYAAAHRQERLQVLKSRHSELESAHSALERRQEGGDASAFDVERMGRELRQVALLQKREQIAVDSELLEIGSLVPEMGSISGVVGSLGPASCPTLGASNPRLRAFDHRIEAVEHVRASAKAGNAPELETRAGWAAVIGSGELAQGFVAGIGLRIPFWGYGDFAEDRADARARTLRADKQLLEREISARADRAATRCARFLELASEADASVAATAQLVGRAQAGYAAAELSLLELVDAQRALLEDRLDQLNLLAAAREAELDWRYETGGWP